MDHVIYWNGNITFYVGHLLISNHPSSLICAGRCKFNAESHVSFCYSKIIRQMWLRALWIVEQCKDQQLTS